MSKKKIQRTWQKRNEMISRHAPKRIRDMVLKLIMGKEFSSNTEKARLLYNLLGKLWNCTDKVPTVHYKDIVADCLQPYCSTDFIPRVKPPDFTYAMLARNLRPVLRAFLELKNER